MGGTKLHTCSLWNRDYTTSTEGLFRIVELFFGGGAWGIIAGVPSVPGMLLSGPYVFYMWVVAGSWAVTLAAYLLSVTSQKLERQPTVHSLAMASCFGLLHVIAAILFCVYAFHFLTWDRSQATTVAVLVWITTVVYLAHACSLATYFLSNGVTSAESDAKVTWIWEGLLVSSGPAAKPKPKRNPEANFSEVISNPVAIGTYGDSAHMQVKAGEEDIDAESRPSVDHGVIYEDVPMEPSAPKVEYSGVQQGDNDETAPNGKPESQVGGRVVEENEYLNPV